MINRTRTPHPARREFRGHCHRLDLTETQARLVIFAVVHGTDLRKVVAADWAKLARFLAQYQSKCALAAALHRPATWTGHGGTIPDWFLPTDHARNWPECQEGA